MAKDGWDDMTGTIHLGPLFWQFTRTFVFLYVTSAGGGSKMISSLLCLMLELKQLQQQLGHSLHITSSLGLLGIPYSNCSLRVVVRLIQW